MSHVRILLAAVLSVAALAVLAGPAGASVAAVNPKFCKAADSIGASNKPTTNLTELKKTAAGFKAAAKQAPRKVKVAMLKVSKLLGQIGSNPSDIVKAYSSKGFVQNYSKSVGVYIKYYVANCSG